jgi:hypothetical protein
VLHFGDSSVPVKIRNLSPTGALIEGSCIPVPVPGSAVRLVRGRLAAHALVAWSADGRFGLKFAGPIDIVAWRAAPVNNEQGRVDDIVRLVKAGAVPLSVGQLSLADGRLSPAELSHDLRLASQLLGRLGDAFSSDVVIAANHGAAFQQLDIAMQVIAAVEEIVAGDCDLESGACKLDGLRRSVQQALR